METNTKEIALEKQYCLLNNQFLTKYNVYLNDISDNCDKSNITIQISFNVLCRS